MFYAKRIQTFGKYTETQLLEFYSKSQRDRYVTWALDEGFNVSTQKYDYWKQNRYTRMNWYRDHELDMVYFYGVVSLEKAE